MKQSIRLILIIAILGLPVSLVYASTFEGLVPGESSRGEVYKTLGQPIQVIHRDDTEICLFDPSPYKGKRIQGLFYKSGILKSLTLEPKESYSKEQYEKWFNLGAPSGYREHNGLRVTQYASEGYGLVHENLSPDSPVRGYGHYDDGSYNKDQHRVRLEDDFHAAKEKGDCKAMQKVYETGQANFPKVAWFYIDEITWRIKCDSNFRKKKDYLVSLAEKAAELNPTDESYKFLAFVHVSISKDPARALQVFSRLDIDEHPELHAYIGGCHMELGNNNEAKLHFQAYLAKFPTGEMAKTSRAALKKLK